MPIGSSRTTAVPSGACGCAVVTGTAAAQFTDNLASTSAYTVNTPASQIPVVLTNTSVPTLPINLTSQVSGVLPAANGGTGASSLGAASIPTFTGGFTPGDLVTVQSASPLVVQDGGAPSSGGVSESVWSTGLTQLGSQTGNRISAGGGGAGQCIVQTFANAHTITRFSFHLITLPAGCSTYATFGIRDLTGATTLESITLSSSSTSFEDSGPISVGTTAGHQLGLGIISIASGCSTNATAYDLEILYK